MQSKFTRLALLITTITSVALSFTSTLPIQAQTTPVPFFDPVNVERATVLLMQTYTNPKGVAIISCVGSGTLVTADGLILTNAHVALPSDRCQSDHVVVALNVRIGEPPIPTYYAAVVESNLGFDLAVLRIVSTLDGHPIGKGTLQLPYVGIGDSESVKLDDTLRVVGYSPVTDQSNGSSAVLPATVLGFTEEAQISTQIASRANQASGAAAWIKISGVIPGSTTGGGAYSTDGLLVGIPTIEPALISGAVSNCRRIQDSNGDGVIDNRDTCVPIGGPINAIRPAALAQGLILAATLGITPDVHSPAKPAPLPTDSPKIDRLFFAPGVNQFGMPISVITNAPIGTKDLYLFFDYDNMADGMIYELNTTINGVPNTTFSLAPATWNGGQRGLWYIGSSAQVWPNGNYEFTLFVQGTRVASQKITIGGPALTAPTFSDILFGVFTPQKQLINSGSVLPTSDTINATFVYNNIPANQPWCQRWYQNGLRIAQNSAVWTDGSNGNMPVNIGGQGQPFAPGSYRLELYLSSCDDPNAVLAATSDFVMAGNAIFTGTQIFTGLNFYGGWKNNAPTGSATTTFPDTIAGLAATFDWHALGAGTTWTWRWTVDTRPLFEVTTLWGDDSDGSAFWLRLIGANAIPDGTYKLELLTGNTVMASGTAKVGLGRLPVGVFGTADGVQVEGKIVDAETGNPIPGASFVVLSTTTDSRSFTWQMSDVFDLSNADSQGQFALNKLLPRGITYSVIVIARGYLPVYYDGLQITDQVKSPFTLTIELNRD